MKIISVNAGLPREIFHQGRMIRTGIFKTPLAGRCALTIKNDLAGMRRAAGVKAQPDSWRNYFSSRTGASTA
ncbi:MAG TPA: hypothetical protein VGB09_10585 [Candidatus Binatia bacterium]